MSESNKNDGEGPPNDEFDFYIQFTKPLVLDLRSSEDKAIASAWVQKLEAPPQTEEEKKLRLDYLKLLLFVLQRGRLSGIFKKQPAPGSLQPFPQGFSMADMGNLIIDTDEIQSSGGGDTQSVPYTIELSSDLREFVAAQEIPNFGVQLYYAWSSDDPIHKWSLFDEDKFSSYILAKIKQMKDLKSDDKSIKDPCQKKPCDLSFTKNYTKSKVKSPEEIEKTQLRSYQTYLGLVGRMGGGYKDCDDDQDKCPRRPGSSKKFGASRRCQIEVDEEYENFLSGLSGHNSTQKRNCKCPFPQHRPDCDAHGKGVQPFEERNLRSVSAKSKPENGACNVWPAQGAGVNKRLNVPMDQFEYGAQFSPVASSQQRNMPNSKTISPIRHDMSATEAAYKDCNRASGCTCPMALCTCPCPRGPVQQNFQMDVPRATVGPSPSIVPQGRSGGDRNRMRRPINLMAPPESSVRSGGIGEASGPSQAQLHCYNQQYQNSGMKPQQTTKVNQDSWYPDEDFCKKPEGDDRRKQKMGAPPAQSAPPPSNLTYSCGLQQPVANNQNQDTFTMSPECKRKPKPETFVKSLAYPPQNQVQYDERSPYQHMQPNMGSSEGRGVCPAVPQAEQGNSYKGQSMNRPKSHSDNLGSPNSYSGRAHDLESVFQSIKLKTETHRDKCNRRPQSGEPPAFQKSPQLRSLSPFPTHSSSHPSHQSPAPQNKSQLQPQSQSQSQPQSSGKPFSEAMAEGMMPGQYADPSQNTWAPPSAVFLSPGKQPINTSDYRREGPSSPGKGVSNAGTNQQSQSPGAYRNSQGPPSQTCQRPPPSNYQRSSPSPYMRPPPSAYQGPPPATSQGFQPQTCQRFSPSAYKGPSPSNLQELPPTGRQPEYEGPYDEEDEVSGPESLDECPAGSSTSAEFLENAPCEDVQPAPQQWPAPTPVSAPSARRSPDAGVKEYGRFMQRGRRQMITSTPIQAPFMADESTIPCGSPVMDYQHEQLYGTYNVNPSEQLNQEASYYPICGNADSESIQGRGQSQQAFGGFMEVPNEATFTSSNRRRNMLEAPMPDEQQFTQTPTQFTCSKSGY